MVTEVLPTTTAPDMVLAGPDGGRRSKTADMDDAADRAAHQQLLEELYDEHAEPIFCWVIGMLGNRDQAEDAIQSIWLQLARRKGRLSHLRNRQSYVWSAARNHVASVLRRRRLERLWFRPLEDLENTDGGGSRFEIDSTDPSIDPDERRDLARCVRCLPPRFRAVVLLVSFGGLTLEEAAARLGVPRGTAASRFHTAIQKLKVDLDQGER